MKEDFLHYLWKFQKFSNFHSLQTTSSQSLQIINCGEHNTENSGPDFFNAQLIIENQKWAGTVEIHLKSSDWYTHNHQSDCKYDNVILHVVWEHDVDVYGSNNSPIPTLELKTNTSSKTLVHYRALMNNSKRWINCANQIEGVSTFTVNNWLERLYIERLDSKSSRVAKISNQLNSHWEATCFCLIAQYFGGNKNGLFFLEVAQSIPFNVVQKATSVFQLEALFFGQANLLQKTIDDPYYTSLQQEYNYLKQKYRCKQIKGLQLEFFRLRPTNFPTIRLAQLANLMANQQQLFSKISTEFDLLKLKQTLQTATSTYWKSHYNFGKESKKSIKKTSESFVELLVINAIIPLQFYYAKTTNKPVIDKILALISIVKPEINAITKGFMCQNVAIQSALQSQAVIQLKKEYCNTNRCLKCAIGFELLKGN